MQYQEEQDYTKKFDMGLWRRLLVYAKPYYPHLLCIVLSMGLCAVIDVIFPILTGWAVDNLVVKSTTAGIGPFIAKYLALVVAQVACVFSFIMLAGRVEVGMTYIIRKAGFKRLQELSFSYYDKTAVGYIMARMTSDAQRLGDTIGWVLVDLVWSFGYLLMISVAMLLYNWQLALIVLCIIPPLMVISVYFQKRMLGQYRTVRKTNSRITGAFNEGIMGARTTKTLVREKQNYSEFGDLTSEMRGASIRAAVLSAIYFPIVGCLGTLAVALILWRGGYNVVDGILSIGTLTVFVSYAMQFFHPIQQIARIFAELQSSQAAAERTMDMIETDPEIADTDEVINKYGDNFHPKRENWESLRGDIDFENVSFQYKDGEKVLKNFSLSVKAGQTIALVGETGSGKSTIVNLICRFYEPTEGVIKIDGRDYRERSQLWMQSNLGYVLQQPHLFSGTIRENIRYGHLEATNEQVENAAQLVNAEEFILKLEKGYDTDVGEGGNRLSTGEKQLISFARAILAKPAIFVLDEATSSVDTETEQKIQYAIERTLEGRTSFIIAHRLSTIRSADRILVISDGMVIEEGSHKELIEKKGQYYDLYTNQFTEEKEIEVLAAK